ncbi:phosphotransferase family protein [Corynebacterium sp. UBA2622]|uniref:phosphotransferase family protein n=1 Tax=Corynebacterium sp. UBA2622 TaxID=1946393 RepID=UPI0025BD68ED|nr:phosphotransferase [Corynebacterium sp. UBA2622]
MEQDNVIALAEDILTRRYGGTQRLTDATRLPGSGFSGVYRARVAANPFLQHRSVVVKQSPETGDVLEDAAFLREVVAYQFTTSLSEDVRPGPVLLGYDTAQRIIIISDSGDGDTLETLLDTADDGQRVQILRNLGTALGRMHAGTAGKEDDYNVLFARMMRSRRGQRQVQDLREHLLMHRIRLGAEMLEKSGIAIPAEVAATAERIRARLLHGGNRAFTPFDLAPDNIIYADRTQFLDYEWAGFRDVTFDVGFVVGGFPNYVAARTISDDEAQVFIDAWVREVETTWPSVLHGDTLHASITGALIGWSLSSVSILNANALEEMGQADPQLAAEFDTAGADLEAAVSADGSFEISGDLLRPRTDGPFTSDEMLVRRDLYETFDALARYATLGRDSANLVIADWAGSLAERLR